MLQKAREKAAHERRTLTSVVEEGLAAVLAERPITDSYAFKLAVVGGDAPPFIDVNDRAALFDALDDEAQRQQRGFPPE